MWVDQKDDIKYPVYSAVAGSFGKTWGALPKEGPIPVDDWISCRDLFHKYTKEGKRFYFFHGLEEGRGKSIAVFFDRLETILKLDEDQRTRFGPTNKRLIIWVEMSEWWRAQSIRRSLFTALMRQSIGYRLHKDNFDETLYWGEYTVKTKDALKRFLEGHTFYWGGYRGWIKAFDPSEWRGQTARTPDPEKLLRDYARPMPAPVKKLAVNIPETFRKSSAKRAEQLYLYDGGVDEPEDGTGL